MHVSVRRKSVWRKFLDGNQLDVGQIDGGKAYDLYHKQMEKAKNVPLINKAGSFVTNPV